MRQGFGRVNLGQLPAITFVALLALAACDTAPATTQVVVEDAQIRLSPVPGRPASGYFRSRGPDSVRLVSVTSPTLERIELHGSMATGNTATGGMMTMSPLTPAQLRLTDGELLFAPGANHAMIFGVPATLRPGARVPLTFTFDGAPPVTVQADVRSITGA